ncbi:MAG TPA: metallophosphoesterase [Actinomycetes bacterium]|nr:metallophosphoesterase [Actinomycetes bacterium]
MLILHLSDTHLESIDTPNIHGVNAQQSLRQMLCDLVNVQGIHVVVISGDIADDGSRGAYRAARELIGEFARERNIPAIYSTGNHDERLAFTEVLGSGHLDANGLDRALQVVSSPETERAVVSFLDGRRFVTLDSLVPGKGYGKISQTQLLWLRDVLAVPAPRGTVLVFHHPPITLDVEVQRALGLQNSGELADAIRDTDVQLILCGHFHMQIFGHLDTTAVWVTPGVVSRIDLTAPPRTERAVRGASATLVRLGDEQPPVFHLLHARDPRVGETVYELDETQLREVIERLGP